MDGWMLSTNVGTGFSLGDLNSPLIIPWYLEWMISCHLLLYGRRKHVVFMSMGHDIWLNLSFHKAW